MPTSASTISGGSRCTRSIASLSVSHGNDLDVFVRERQLDDALDRDAVIRKQELVRHGYMIP